MLPHIQIEKISTSNILAIKNGLPFFFFPPTTWSCQCTDRQFTGGKSSSVWSEQPKYVTLNSCTTCADVAVSLIVTLCTDETYALLWRCTVILSDPVCSAFKCARVEFCTLLCRLCIRMCMKWLHLFCTTVTLAILSSLNSWGGILSRVWGGFFCYSFEFALVK